MEGTICKLSLLKSEPTISSDKSGISEVAKRQRGSTQSKRLDPSDNTMLHSIDSPTSLRTFITAHPHSLVCFSATWCGPCTASKPRLEALASQFASDSASVACGIIDEHVFFLGEDIPTVYKIRVFPTYVLFERGGAEVGRVEGVKLEEVATLVGERMRKQQ